MFVEEHLNLFVVGGAQGIAGNGDFIAVCVLARCSEVLNFGGEGWRGGGEDVVEDSGGGEVRWGEGVPGVVGEAAVALVSGLVAAVMREGGDLGVGCCGSRYACFYVLEVLGEFVVDVVGSVNL